VASKATGCMCRIAVDEVAMPMFVSGPDFTEWCEAHQVEILPDHLGRPSVDVATAYRLRAEADEHAERSLRATQEARAAHVAAVAELRDAVAALSSRRPAAPPSCRRAH
jgi:hypothetical protein